MKFLFFSSAFFIPEFSKKFWQKYFAKVRYDLPMCRTLATSTKPLFHQNKNNICTATPIPPSGQVVPAFLTITGQVETFGINLWAKRAGHAFLKQVSHGRFSRNGLGTIKGQKLTQSSSYHFHVSEYI
jgi:hypothetical protein